jgi:hypothetical protein
MQVNLYMVQIIMDKTTILTMSQVTQGERVFHQDTAELAKEPLPVELAAKKEVPKLLHIQAKVHLNLETIEVAVEKLEVTLIRMLKYRISLIKMIENTL